MITAGNILKQVTVEAGSEAVEANQFLKRQKNRSAVFVSDLSIVDLNLPGEYPVQLQVGLFTYDCILKVQDTVKPVAATLPVTAVSVTAPEPEAFVTQIQDVSPVTVSFVTPPDMQKEGEQDVSVALTDTSGNTTVLQSTLTVLIDCQSPLIEGITPLRVYWGHVPDYTGCISVSDDFDAEPVLSVDDGRVDLSSPGIYAVTYTAVDVAGNKSTVATTVTVISDDTPPVIYGVRNISLYQGGTVAYRSGITVEDDTDMAPV